MRLLKDELPVVHVALALEAAERYSLELAAELLKGPPGPRPMH